MTYQLMLGFITGLLAGASLGCFIMGMCVAAHRRDE